MKRLPPALPPVASMGSIKTTSGLGDVGGEFLIIRNRLERLFITIHAEMSHPRIGQHLQHTHRPCQAPHEESAPA